MPDISTAQVARVQATWVGGTYPPGQGGQPVRGVSWFEAQAYCRWTGKELPHRVSLVRCRRLPRILGHPGAIHFSGQGPAPVDPDGGIGPYGHLDLAGNVREWVANDVSGQRFVLGGAWDSPPYLFYIPEAVSPQNRSDQNGFRCALMSEGPEHPSRAPSAPPRHVGPAHTHGSRFDRRLSEVLRLRCSGGAPRLRRQRLGRASQLAARICFVRRCVRERTRLSRPLSTKGARPPFRTVVFHPGSDAGHLTDSRAAHTGWFDFLGSQGYAVAYPVYKGTYGASGRGDRSRGRPRSGRAAGERPAEVGGLSGIAP